MTTHAWGRIKAIMKEHGLAAPWASFKSDIVASIEVVAASKLGPTANSTIGTLDDDVLWGLVQAALENMQLLVSDDDLLVCDELDDRLADLDDDEDAEDADSAQCNIYDTTSGMTNDTGALMTKGHGNQKTITKHQTLEPTKAGPLVRDPDPPNAPKLQPLESAKLEFTPDVIQTIAPFRNNLYSALEHFSRTKESKNVTRRMPTWKQPPPREAKIVIGGLQDDMVGLAIVRYIHLLGFGRVIHASSTENVFLLCQSTADSPDPVDVVCFVVGRTLDRAVPILDKLTGLVGERVIMVGNNPDEPLKEIETMRECMAHGALYFATIPVDFAALRAEMQRALELQPYTYIFRRKQEKPLSMLFKALNRQDHVKNVKPNAVAQNAPTAAMQRLWFKPKGMLPSLTDMATKLLTKEHAANDGGAEVTAWPPPMQISTGRRATRLSSLPAVEISTLISHSWTDKRKSQSPKKRSARSTMSAAHSSRRSTTTRGYESDI
ncbi:Aste57867_11129 [Aphanomyces stellatus]|uniref:Aste57867_11129 protein n=1 Tax=Aphanomyces stellatus TaxID=120398 RepID=A0A485KS90_9STRA|nr:hypothetical protein As57867_011087 [Aphanomyces stellatus]VFT87996.1 Aste57867_11129 [Aphanomyces stellatus]